MALESKAWLHRQLEPVAKAASAVPPDLLTWLTLTISLGISALLYNAPDRPWLAVLAVPLIMARLSVSAVEDLLIEDKGRSAAAGEVIKDLSERLSDVAVFLAIAFWPDVKILFILLAIIAMLIVSYVGVLGKAVAGRRIREGVLGGTERMVLLMVACLMYGVKADFDIDGLNVFEAMFVLFIPLATVTLLQRLDKIFAVLSEGDK